jgi:predicted transcriptional regulator
VEIVADILNIVKDGARKTQIMYKGNLSYKLLVRYLGRVVDAGLAHVDGKDDRYRLTSKGEVFLRQFESYVNGRTELEKNLSAMRKQKAGLEAMCTLGSAWESLGWENDWNGPPKGSRRKV